MVNANPYQQYKAQSLSTMTAGELLITLYDEVIKRVKQGILALDEKNFEMGQNSIYKAQDIVRYLTTTLNDQYAVSQELTQLYNFFHAQLVEANVRRDVEVLRSILPMLEELRDTWKQADKMNRVK